MTHYEYVHRAGYGRDDHMADEIIARAARVLGLDGAGSYVAQAAGFASHSVPMGRATVSLASGPGVRARMKRALRKARSEVRCRDTCIVVVAVRHRYVAAGSEYSEDTIIEEHRRGTHWVVVDSRVAP